MTEVTDTIEQRRAANKEACATLRSDYEKLPAPTRQKLKAEFADHRARSPLLSWARYLKVVLPLLPAEAR